MSKSLIFFSDAFIRSFFILTSKKKRGSKKDAINDEERKRLSTMAEDDEEDGPISIKIVSPSNDSMNQTSGEPGKDSGGSANHNETSV